MAFLPFRTMAQWSDWSYGSNAPLEMKGKTVVGGHVSGGASGNCIYFTLSPQIGYRLSKGLEAGVRLGYSLQYYFDSYYGNCSVHHFSAGLYANYEIYRGIYLHVEDEESCLMTSEGFFSNPTAPQWYNSLFIGGGYRQYFSTTAYAYVSLLYNLSWDYTSDGWVNSPYSRPLLYRMGYCYGF